MTQPSRPSDEGETYIHGWDPRWRSILASRKASVDAAFFAPLLRPGMKLLDCGCGPGSLTVDLAQLVAPGEVVGIDLEDAQFENARTLAAQHNVTNVSFSRGDIYQLPFPDNSFDAAFAHTMLQHCRNPNRALREILRVLKPGGVLGVRDEDWGTVLWEPSTPGLRELLALYTRVWQHNGGDPFFPRHQRRLLAEAQFENVEASASANAAGQRAMTLFFARFWTQQLQETAFTGVALREGWTTEAAIRGYREAVQAWATDRGAFWAITFCAAVGWKPA